MKVALFGGSFDPVHSEHVRLVRAARDELNLDAVIVMPSCEAPHKRGGAHASGEDRLAACKIAFRNDPFVVVSGEELERGGTSYTYLTCRRFAERYPDAERYFLVGADMLENFFSWREPEEILRHVTLAACGRGEETPASLHERFVERFGCDFVEFSFTGEEVSSTEVRVRLAFGKDCDPVDPEVLRYLRERGLYRYPLQEKGLALEKEARREHSFRVAELACRRARSSGVPETDALLAAMLHDCGKSVPLDSPLLLGFTLPEGVPAPVVHQYAGAFLAERFFGIEDEAILDAIRFHTSGRAGMSPLEKLIFLSDMLEEGRSYEGVEGLRALFFEDLDLCLKEALREQIEYLKTQKGQIYALTEEAFRWISEQKA